PSAGGAWRARQPPLSRPRHAGRPAVPGPPVHRRDAASGAGPDEDAERLPPARLDARPGALAWARARRAHRGGAAGPRRLDGRRDPRLAGEGRRLTALSRFARGVIDPARDLCRGPNWRSGRLTRAIPWAAGPAPAIWSAGPPGGFT